MCNVRYPLIAFALAGCTVYDSQPGSGVPTPECAVAGSVPDAYPCGCDEACAAPEAVCFTEAITGWAQGACIHECAADAACAVGDVCGYGYCSPPCVDSDDCTTGRVCAERDDGALFCDVLCQADDECLSGFCHLYSGLCLPQGSTVVGAGVAAPCTDPGECKSGACVLGACGSLCDTRRQVCPDQTTCVAIGAGDEGLCLPACERDQDCAGYGFTVCAEFPEGRFCFTGS